MGFETNTHLDMVGDWVSAFPSPMDGWIRSALSGFEDLLFAIAGDPDELSRVHTVWMRDTELPRDLAREQELHRDSLLQGWSGDGRMAFDTNMAALEGDLPFLGENFEKLAELLKQSGEAAIATVNAIVELIATLLIWLLSEAFIALAMSLVTFGASVAAWFGSAAIKFGIATTRVSAMVFKLEGIIISILAAIEAAALAVTLLRTAGAMGLILLKTVPKIAPATSTADELS